MGWVSWLGKDELGEWIFLSIKGEGIDVKYVIFDDYVFIGFFLK